MEVEKDKLNKYFEQQRVAGPSPDFTSQVMGRVEEIVERPFEVKPLISKKGWWYILFGALIVVAGSFSLEFAGSIQKMPSFFNWENINLSDFTNSIKIAVGVLSLLSILTVADILYRRVKNIA